MYRIKSTRRAVFCAALMVMSPAILAATTYQKAKPATEATAEFQKNVSKQLPQDNGNDEAWARQGYLGNLADPVSRTSSGEVVMNPMVNDWMQGEAPPSVNPSLWRHEKLLAIHGLFQVSENVWQVRGYDAANVTIIRGDTGWIILDTGLTTEAARNVMKLVEQELGKRPVSGVIYSHSHVDHFGGIRGILGDQQEIPPILAPENMVEEAGSEWVMAGNVMTRRGTFQWGTVLPDNAEGFVGSGLSSDVPIGTITLIPPSDEIKATGETRVLDGVTFEFQMVPETEAVAEMNVFIPEEKVFYIAEFATATMHNIQTPRGAKARDARKWAYFLTEALNLYGDKSDAVIFGHTWPRFGNAEVKNFIRLQRDNYKFVHDQTLRMMNEGYTPLEVAEQLKPPKALAEEWSTHGYYGTYKHNAKGVYQYYIGWWDGIPANLDRYPAEEMGKRYLKLVGEERMMAGAREAFEAGDYRWAAELMNQLVFAQPDNAGAKALLADSYEQLGYQAESGVWRNIYLTGAAELRGAPAFKDWLAGSNTDLTNSMSTASFLDLMATRLNPDKVGDSSITLQMHVVDRDETFWVTVANAVLVGEQGKQGSNPDITLSGTRDSLLGLFLGQQPLEAMKKAGLDVSGDTDKLRLLQSAIEKPPTDFNVVVP